MLEGIGKGGLKEAVNQRKNVAVVLLIPRGQSKATRYAQSLWGFLAGGAARLPHTELSRLLRHVSPACLAVMLTFACSGPEAADRRVEMDLAMSDRLVEVLKHASSMELNDPAGEVEPLHLLVAVVSERNSMAEALLILSGTDAESLRNHLVGWSTDDRGDVTEAKYSGEVLEILARSQRWAFDLGDPYWGEEHVLLALTESRNSEIQEVMVAFHISTGRLVAAWEELMSAQ
jgi:hypothetical protein